MSPTRVYQIVLIVLWSLVYVYIAKAAPSVKPAQPFEVQGNWKLDTVSNIGWVKTANDLRFISGPALGSKHDFSAVYNDPLPEGDWTLDMCVRLVGTATHLSIAGASATPQRIQRFIPIAGIPVNPGKDSCLRWIRIACSYSQEKMTVMIDGKQVTFQGEGLTRLPVAPLQLQVYLSSADNVEREALRVVSFVVTKGADTPMRAVGPAFTGWPTPRKADAFKNVTSLDKRLETVYQAAETDKGRADVLATKMLVDYSAQAAISAGTWQQLSSFIKNLPPNDQDDLMAVLSIAAACGSTVQREQVKIWAESFFVKGFGPKAASQALLLDPVYITRLDHSVNYLVLPYWTQVLQKSAPQYTLLPMTRFLNDHDWNPKICAWFLPEIMTTSPAYGKELHAALLDLLNDPNSKSGAWDEVRSFAAARMAPHYMALAQEFLAGINSSETKANTIIYIAEDASAGKPFDDATARQVESLLKQYSTDKSNMHPWETTTSRLLPLINFYISQHQNQKAIQTLTQASSAIDGTPEVIRGDTISVARLKRKLHTDDYRMWWDRAVALATAQDKEIHELNSPGDIYISPSTLLARDLVADNQLDAALTIASGMDPDTLRNNKSMILASIILKLLHTDVPQAVALLGEFPKGDAKINITINIATKLAQTDLPRALQQIEPLPQSAQTNTLLYILESSSPRQDIALEKLKAIIAATGFKRTIQSTTRYGLMAPKWSRLPVDTLLSLWEPEKKTPDYFAYCLLFSTAHALELDDDPMWIQYSGNYKTDSSIPWGPTSIRDVGHVKE
jgi:hypothetical protein